MIHELVGKQHVSSKSRDLLSSRGLGAALFDKDSGVGGWPVTAQVQDDTLSVLIIRISFETNRDPHLTTIDPSGDFVFVPDAALPDLSKVTCTATDADGNTSEFALNVVYWNFQHGCHPVG